MDVSALLSVNVPVKFIQLEKAYAPIVVTEFGIVNEPVRLEHPKKTLLPIEVMAFGNVSFPLKLAQF